MVINIKFQSVLLTLVLFLFSNAVIAAKVYKWVDENGKTHFSQTPPIKDESNVSNGKVEIKETSGSLLLPKSLDGDMYCGDLKLPKESKYRRLTTKHLNDKISYWEKSLKRSRNSLERYLAPKRRYRSNSSYRNSAYRKKATYNEELERYQKPVNQYQCAIDWAKKKYAEASQKEQGQMSAKEEAERDLEVATAQMHRICGEEPERYNEYGNKRKRYLTWKRCVRRYGSVVREMKYKLRKIERGRY